jgi:two-component system sensor histidine kinase KdpD
MQPSMPDPKQPADVSADEPDLQNRVLPPEPAKLKIYLGAAPGVGKTYQMLEDAHLMR